jgi:Glycosyl hydrolases family 18
MPGTTQPRNVIYYNNGSVPLGEIIGLPYTDVILAFLVPDSNFNLMGQGGAFGSDGKPAKGYVQALHNDHKNVLISVGGQDGWPASEAGVVGAWQQYAQNLDNLVQQIVNYVSANGFDGVDIDFEDNSGFTGGPKGAAIWPGVKFLIDLTNGFAQALPAGQNIITHAPAPNYFDPKGGYSNAYSQVFGDPAAASPDLSSGLMTGAG